MTTPVGDRAAGMPAGAEALVWQPPTPGEEEPQAIEEEHPPATSGSSSGEAAPELTAADGPDQLEGSPNLAAIVSGVGVAHPVRVRPPGRRPTSTTVLLAVSVLVALGGVSFAVGRMTSSAASQTASDPQTGVSAFDPGASGAPGLRGDGLGGPGTGTAIVSGTVVSVTADSITIKEADGQTVTIATGSSTSYHSQTSATGTDVTTGATVVVQTSGAAASPGTASASASPGAISRTATDVTITGK